MKKKSEAITIFVIKEEKENIKTGMGWRENVT